MTTYSFADDYPDNELAFDPTVDVLDLWSNASNFKLTDLADGSGVVVSTPWKSLTLTGASIETLNESNFRSDDGSKLVNAYLGNSFSTDLSGTSTADLLVGGPVHHEIQEVIVSTGADPTNVYAVAPSLSAEGRFVVFDSNALHQDGDSGPNGVHDVWMKDLTSGEVTRVSTSAGGAPGNQASHDAFVSGNGHFVVFESEATNFAAGDTNGATDIYMKDVVTGQVIRVSAGASGVGSSSGASSDASASHDGRYVVFTSEAADLVTGDANAARDVFLKDTTTGTLTLLSTDTSGVRGDAASYQARISANGKFVVFTSWSSNLAEGDTSEFSGVFVKNIETGEVTCVSHNDDDNSAIPDAKNGAISADGRYVAFESSGQHIDVGAGLQSGSIYLRDMQTGDLMVVKGEGTTSNGCISISGDGRYVVFVASESLDAADTNGVDDVYVKDMKTGTVALVSQDALGAAGDGASIAPQVSLDGSTIVFQTNATNLTSDDDNQAASTVVLGNPLFTDTLRGGDGNDVYLVSNTGDRIVELEDQGTDLVQSSVSFVLSDFVENLTLTGAANLNGTGNAQANTITGNSGSNVLSSGDGGDTLDGRAGADTMVGGDGEDIYYVDNAADVVIEAGGEGIDSITSSISLTLMDNVEFLSLGYGVSAVNATGNSLNNVLYGNWYANVLNGMAGADIMEGGSGDDTYIVDNVGDQVREYEEGGIDTVQSSVTFSLNNGWDGEVEKLTLTGSAAINASGNNLNNTIVGNTAANVLNGSAGSDTMTGGAGNDTYVVDYAGDRLVEVAGGGTDLVQSAVSFVLQAEFENLTLTDGGGPINGTGNALANFITGNAGANTLDGKAGADTMTGAAGNDTYVVDNAYDYIVEAAHGGIDTVQSSLSLELRAEIEKLTLTGTAAINGTGNELNNTLIGNSAANRLDGGQGADTMTGGAGNDTYAVDQAADRVIEIAGGGIDTVEATVSFTLEAEFENLTLTDDGNESNGTGNSLNNVITGNYAANTLDGKAGADTMSGGSGDDTYVIDNVGDRIYENANSDIDSVLSSISFSLATSWTENLTLTGSSAINGTGNWQRNILVGNSAANRLDGGDGYDRMTGGAGDDTYIVDNVNDETIETANGGNDSVRSSISFTLQAEVENLTLTGSAAINGTGNTLANAITGNGADNVINGGAGADTMTGGAGDDTYVVTNVADQTIELASGGTDLVQSAVSLTLQTEVENLTLTGSAAIDGTGNTLANVITGNAAVNVLNGHAGADRMTGAAGNDTYVVDNAGDRTIEITDGGIDLVQSSVSFTLQAQVENLRLTGSAAVNGTGNSLANTLVGNAAANVLDGQGGADKLTGGAGADIFAFTSSLSSDLITDFTSGVDKLRLSQATLRIGDGDTVVEGVATVAGPNGFSTAAELVVVTHNISGSLTAASAASAIGHANSNYTVGDTRLFVVDNGSDCAVYLFKSADAGSTVSANELTLIATLDGTASTGVTDYLFGA